ncbi:hypothetical protein [Lysinibacillus xylanilyticus]|uniref:hypothetical protein n=1 Tax=Lysinibacillus xylanilyticus TaxID=582475 RepID=UPI003CFCF45C
MRKRSANVATTKGFCLCESEASATRFYLCESEATATRFYLCESEATATTTTRCFLRERVATVAADGWTPTERS